jgi:acyl dehydratase
VKKIKTLRDLQDYLNKEIRLDATCVTQAQVDQFGKDTGDVNDHNSISTKHFNKPAVQGFFSLGLFGGFHKQVCQIENADPLNAEVIARLKKHHVPLLRTEDWGSLVFIE